MECHGGFPTLLHLGVSQYRVFYPKSSILIGFSIINHSFWGAPIFGNTIFFVIGHDKSLNGDAQVANGEQPPGVVI